MRRLYTTPLLGLLTLVFVLSLTLWGCAPKQIVKSTDLLSTPNLLVEADAAWESKHYEAVELYYSKVLERADLVKSELPTIYTRLARAAFLNDHYHQARIALENWANIDTQALNDSLWEQSYLDTMAALGKTERLRNHLEWVLRTATVPWETRSIVARWYANYYIQRSDYLLSLDVLARFYAQAPDRMARMDMEHDYFALLHDTDDIALADLSKNIGADDLWEFPYALVSFEYSTRKAVTKEAWPAAWRNLRNISSNANLEDLAPLELKLTELEVDYGIPRVGIALALPLSGPYAKVGVKVLRGAGLAQWRLAQRGVDIELRVLNTESSDWEKRLAALPSDFSVVGGPLRVSAFKQLYENIAPGQRETNKRAFFAFLASLGDLQEGNEAWRFFSSRNDEVRSLVKLAVNDLNIKDLAIFYPEEKFGRTMAETFYREAYPLGGRIKGMQSYPSHDLKQWGKRVGKLLDVPADFSENKDDPLPPTDFGAVFLPDGWSQAQTLLPNFFFYEGDQLVFLGPGLWSRALDSSKDIDEHYYRLAVCPGAWWEHSDGGRALQNSLTEEGLGQADFWVALGYDFLRFAGKLGAMPPHWGATDVNKRIEAAQDMMFSMAPITWDDKGVASQELFLFSPVRNGKELVNAEQMANRIARAKARREKRIDAYEKRIEEEKTQQKKNIF